MTTSADIIDGLVNIHMGAAPKLYQDDFRQALEALVLLAKVEERKDMIQEVPGLPVRKLN